MQDLINRLNYLTKKYDEGNPEVSDKEYDELYFKLLKMEKEAGYALPNSPTQRINYQVVNELKKVEHNHKMLSLDKTKEISEIESFLGKNDYVAMAKLDGLTCSLRYLNGRLFSAETRGNGIIGEDITHNAKILPSIPKKINCNKELIVDGEIICLDSDFKPFSTEYKNSRNFASGSIRLLDSKECARRHLTFVAWDVISGIDNNNFIERLEYIQSLGFKVVPWIQENPVYAVDDIQDECKKYGYPIDGIVFKFTDLKYGQSLGATAHHFKNAIAYKFYDEEYETRLLNIEYSMGRTGILTPVAVFEPIDDGESIIERASLHNINIMREILGYFPYVNEKIWVVKQNMIIPQVVRSEARVKFDDNHIEIPKVCPICGSPTKINSSKQLYCTNSACEGKFINHLDHFCGKKGLDIRGLSKTTLEKLVEWGWINNIIDIFSLKKYKTEWINKPGFGEKSVSNILNAIEESKNCSFVSFISALGIPLIGKTVATELTKYFSSYEEFYKAIEEKYDFSQLYGFADNKTNALLNFDYSEANQLYNILNITFDNAVVAEENLPLKNKKYVITGSVHQFKNRTELQNFIEKLGGKVVSTVSSNVNYLINNDINSTSIKNKTAKKLNIPIITETEFMESLN